MENCSNFLSTPLRPPSHPLPRFYPFIFTKKKRRKTNFPQRKCKLRKSPSSPIIEEKFFRSVNYFPVISHLIHLEQRADKGTNN